MPGITEPGTMPQRPGMSGRVSGRSVGRPLKRPPPGALPGATMMSQVLVPMILTRMPGPMPEPTAPAWASNVPTATGSPADRPTRSAISAVSSPALRSLGSACLA